MTFNRTLVSTKRKRVERYEGSWTGSKFRHVKVGYADADVELWIDVDALLEQMAAAAMRNKTRLSRTARGAIEVRAINYRETPA